MMAVYTTRIHTCAHNCINSPTKQRCLTPYGTLLCSRQPCAQSTYKMNKISTVQFCGWPTHEHRMSILRCHAITRILSLALGRPTGPGQRTDFSCVCVCVCVADGVVMWRGLDCEHWPTSGHKKLCAHAHDLHVWWRRATAATATTATVLVVRVSANCFK